MTLTHEPYQETTGAYIGAFIDALASVGVRQVCFAPGSRSTPLAVMLAQHPGIKLWSHLDERSAGFFALGLSRASGEPVGLVCSSGTATANFLPAVIEARHSRIPLVILTADRPPELRDVGAPQAIDQLRLYGDHAKWFVDVALPESSPSMLRYARMLGARAAATALAEPAGPVHLNFPLREPLMPAIVPVPAGVAEEHDIAVGSGMLVLPASRLRALADELAGVERGLIVAGPIARPLDGAAVVKLARALGWPVLADPLSGLRAGAHVSQADGLICDSYDAFLRDGQIAAKLAPATVLRFGAMPTSKPVLQYLERHPQARHVVVDSGGGWEDPALLASRIVRADPSRLCCELACLIEAERSAPSEASEWPERWRAIDRAARAAIQETIFADDELFEGRVFAELAALLPAGGTLFAGNSMPVRDLDTFFPSTERKLRFLSNRGANGIDGVVSTALGVAAAGEGPLLLAIGDISFYHDMNGLLAAKRHRLNATIVLLNNDGGGIFSFLPQASIVEPQTFEALFGTPHGLDFHAAAALYGASFTTASSWPEFRAAVRESLAADGLRIIEVKTERARNVGQHRALWQAVSDALAKLLSGSGDGVPE